MATSGSIDFSQDAESIIRDILYMSNVLTPGEDLEEDDSQLVIRAINRLLKRWQSRGILIWKLQDAYLFPDKTNLEYTIGASGTAHMSDSSVLTEVATAASSGASTLVVDSTTGMTAADNIGIELDDGTRQWTTINSVDSATALTLDTTLNDDVAVDNTVFTYTTKSSYPLHIDRVRFYDYTTDIERPLLVKDRAYIKDIPDKTLSHDPSCFFYDRGNQQTGTFIINSKMSSIKDYFTITYEKVVEDIDSISDDVDWPVEWYDAIIYNTAVCLAPVFRNKVSDDLKMLAAQSLADARRMNTELDVTESYIDR